MASEPVAPALHTTTSWAAEERQARVQLAAAYRTQARAGTVCKCMSSLINHHRLTGECFSASDLRRGRPDAPHRHACFWRTGIPYLVSAPRREVAPSAVRSERVRHGPCNEFPKDLNPDPNWRPNL